jgi:hypothetical protein
MSLSTAIQDTRTGLVTRLLIAKFHTLATDYRKNSRHPKPKIEQTGNLLQEEKCLASGEWDLGSSGVDGREVRGERRLGICERQGRRGGDHARRRQPAGEEHEAQVRPDVDHAERHRAAARPPHAIPRHPVSARLVATRHIPRIRFQKLVLQTTTIRLNTIPPTPKQKSSQLGTRAPTLTG